MAPGFDTRYSLLVGSSRAGLAMLGVGAALFISGIAFIVAGARAAQQAPPPSTSVKLTPVATVKQIMSGIALPAANVIFRAVATSVTKAGVEEVVPKNDAEWARVADTAASLVEAGNLLMMEGRAVDAGEWTSASRAMIAAAMLARKAAADHDPEGVLVAGGDLTIACDKCHERYRRD